MKLYAVAAVAILTSATAACSSDDCGDGACQACMVSNPFSCTGDTICVDDVCVPAFGRSYVFTATTATLPNVDNAGMSWDEGGGLPDPFVEIIINGARYTSPPVVDSVSPTWNFATPAVLVPADTALRVAVHDDDEPLDDLAWACTADPLAIEYIRGGSFGCSGPGTLPGARVTVTVRAE